jgi:hypothetical protein
MMVCVLFLPRLFLIYSVREDLIQDNDDEASLHSKNSHLGSGDSSHNSKRGKESKAPAATSRNLQVRGGKLPREVLNRLRATSELARRTLDQIFPIVAVCILFHKCYLS